ncbi:MAG: hypothetical protein M1473_01030, partial [Firmicutes bacterium]|nr:hypothetical protein [Bacillota bacterium]
MKKVITLKLSLLSVALASTSSIAGASQGELVQTEVARPAPPSVVRQAQGNSHGNGGQGAGNIH